MANLSAEALILFADSRIHQNEAFLDPMFWKCLGIEEKWHVDKARRKNSQWFCNWHNLVTSRADLKSTEDYFASILKKE